MRHHSLFYFCLFFSLVHLLMACATSVENELNQERAIIEGNKITPLTFYVNQLGDTLNFNSTVKAEVQIADYAALGKNKTPILDRITTTHNNAQQKTASPIILPFQAPLFDTLIHSDTLRLTAQSVQRKLMKISKSTYTKLDPPVLWEHSNGNIRTMVSGQGGIPTAHSDLQLKDQMGDLWFTSSRGLSKYDGVSVTHFTLPDLGLTRKKTLFQDQDGNIWVSLGAQIVRYDGKLLTLFEQQTEFKNEVKGFQEDQAGRIWSIAANGPFYITDSSIVKLPNLRGYTFDKASLFTDQNKHIWVAGFPQKGSPIGFLLSYDGRHLLKIKDTLLQTTKAHPNTAAIDQAGHIWMVGEWNKEAALIRFDGKQLIIYGKESGFHLEHLQTAQLFFSKKGNVLIKSKGGVLTEFDGQQFNRLFVHPEQIDIGQIVEDEAEQLWFTAAESSEVFVYSAKQFKHIDSDQTATLNMDGASNFMDHTGKLWWKNNPATQGNSWSAIEGDSLTTFTFAQGVGHPFWVDSEGGIWDKWSDQLHHYQNGLLETIPIQGFTERIVEKEEQFWIPTSDHHLHILSEEALLTTSYNQEFFSETDDQNIPGILVDDRQHFWMSNRSTASLAKFDGTYWHYFRFPLGDATSVRSYSNSDPVEDKQGNIWFLLGKHSLVKYDGQTFWQYDFEQLGSIVSLIEDDQNRIWLTTSNKGIGLFDGEYLQIINQEDGLLDNQIYSLHKDFKNRIWAASINGISIIEQTPNQPPKIYTLEKADGLNPEFFPFDQGISFAENANMACLHSLSGLTFVDLAKLPLSKLPPQNLRLCELTINQQFTDFGRLLEYQPILKESFSEVPPFLNYPIDLSVPHYIDNLSFHFSASHWEAPHDIRYSFKLEGIDQDWSLPQHEPNITYRNLPYGRHTLLARTKNEANIWSSPFAYPFTIRPPFWLSWWAYLLYFVVLGLIGYASFLGLKRRMQLRHAYVQKQQEAQQLKELNTFKSRLYTNLTHEFRTPLTVILGMVNQMREAPKKYFDEGTLMIERNGDNLLRLINQLLDLSKLEDQSFQLQLEQGDVVNYLRYLTESFQTYVNSHNLSIRFLTTLEVQQMDYDAEQLKQVLTNLISNAVKFTPSGGHIKVHLSKKEEKLLLKISDTGVGIAAEKLPHIFDRFYQADNSSTRKREGTGIGLAHTKELVRLMGGSIEVESELARGTTFLIVLPITQNSPLSHKKVADPILSYSANYTSNEKANQVAPNTDHRPHLLIVEDNHDVVAYLKACLEEFYQIDVAYNGKIGIEKALEQIPDLIISDVMMPEKDGYEVCDILKNDQRSSHIPIILLTAKADASSKIVGLRKGADAYLSKPFDKEELLVRLEMLVQRQRKLATYFGQQLQKEGNGKGATIAEIEEDAILIESVFLQNILAILEKEYSDEHFALPQLCKAIGMSRSQLFRKMKALINQSPSQFIRSFRLKKAKALLEAGNLNVNEVSWETGFTSPTHFAKVFKEEFGFNPSNYRSKKS
ncbi:MAG: ATP-binding protein [Bacteroidota bacterium]